MTEYAIHWFRRDLRIAGNPALKWSLAQSRGRTLGIFFFDSKFLERPDFSHHRFGFFLKTLKALQGELRDAGGDLLVVDRQPDEGFKWVLSKVRKKPNWVSFNRDYEPFARNRDARIEKLLADREVLVHSERDHLVFEPKEVAKNDTPGTYYQVYTPFSKKWFTLFQSPLGQDRIKVHQDSLVYLEKKLTGVSIAPFIRITWNEVLDASHLNDSLDEFISKNLSNLSISLPDAGSVAAYRQAKLFGAKSQDYLEHRDFPAVQGTSKLSIYFKNGSLTPAMVMELLSLSRANILTKSGPSQFLKELIWREFYYHILFHRPDVEGQAFLPQYRELKWENRQQWFDAWRQGRTGFPIVDAGMRELIQTGTMHNRVRMIVASFLTKDLLIDWRWGEHYFMKQLLDGDLAPNNGGWQWAASTGCDPQPYFRIFNPKLQSEKFDPEGAYIKKFVPELSRCSAKEIHGHPRNYIQPIVDHAAQKPKALSLYKK